MQRELVTCPNCSAQLSVKSQLVGQSVMCPSCKNSFTVSTLRQAVSNAGHLYILLNPHFGRLLKIGRTGKKPAERAKELSAATGVPSPFVVLFEVQVSDMVKAESALHLLLENAGYRVNENREFFKAPVDHAIELMKSVAKEFELKPEQVLSTSDNEERPDESINLWDEIEEEADDAYYGKSLGVPNYKKAMSCYEKAASLGSNTAKLRLAEMYAWGKGIKAQISTAQNYLVDALESGMSVNDVIAQADRLKDLSVKTSKWHRTYPFRSLRDNLCGKWCDGNILNHESVLSCTKPPFTTLKKAKALEMLNRVLNEGNEMAYLNLALCSFNDKKQARSYFEQFFDAVERRIDSHEQVDDQWLRQNSIRICAAIGQYVDEFSTRSLPIKSNSSFLRYFREDLNLLSNYDKARSILIDKLLALPPAERSAVKRDLHLLRRGEVWDGVRSILAKLSAEH